MAMRIVLKIIMIESTKNMPEAERPTTSEKLAARAILSIAALRSPEIDAGSDCRSLNSSRLTTSFISDSLSGSLVFTLKLAGNGLMSPSSPRASSWLK